MTILGIDLGTTNSLVAVLIDGQPSVLANEDGELLDVHDDFDLREPVVLGAVAGHTLLSATASVPVPRTPLTLWLQGRNLTDRLYVTDVANGLRPGAARTVTAGVRLVF